VHYQRWALNAERGAFRVIRRVGVDGVIGGTLLLPTSYDDHSPPMGRT
jgi:hypothetical protein